MPRQQWQGHFFVDCNMMRSCRESNMLGKVRIKLWRGLVGNLTIYPTRSHDRHPRGGMHYSIADWCTRATVRFPWALALRGGWCLARLRSEVARLRAGA